MPAPCGLVLQAKSDPLPTRYRSNPSSAEAYDHRDLGATNTECLLNGGQSKSRIRSREEKKPGTRPTSVSKVHAPRVLGNRAPEAAVSQQSPFMQSGLSRTSIPSTMAKANGSLLWITLPHISLLPPLEVRVLGLQPCPRPATHIARAEARSGRRM